MRTSFISLFGLVGIALAAPATLDGSDYACSKTGEYSMTHCCPAEGPCNFRMPTHIALWYPKRHVLTRTLGPMPKVIFTEDFLKSFCSGQEKVASCCIYSDVRTRDSVSCVLLLTIINSLPSPCPANQSCNSCGLYHASRHGPLYEDPAGPTPWA